MSIQYWSQGIILVNLPSQLQEHDELQEVMEMVHEQGACNVVVDFASVGVAGCATLTRLLQLRQLLQDRGCKLVLCSVVPATMGIFVTARLDAVFDFVQDKFAALAHLEARRRR